MTATIDPTLEVMKAALGTLRTARLRSMREFAEDEILIPTGPFAGRKFKVSRNPFAGLWFEAVESGKWKRTFSTGPQQTGKTFITLVIPLMYHLFEIGETCICGLPSLDMVKDKWNEDILPVIEASRYREFLPVGGSGSRGGTINSRVRFQNGATLRFMTGGGNDKTRSAFTARPLFISEVDGMDEPGGTSREADKITQLEGRTRAFGERARIYGECTVSLEEGRTWEEYTKGTQSRIVIRCQKCRAYVTPEREHLVGWREAENVMQAGASAQFCCPVCGEIWTEEDRAAANADCLLLHRGQTMNGDKIEGDLPATDTLGFRWTAVNNMLVKPATIAMGEWKAAHANDEENAEKAQRQFVWALPHKPSKEDMSGLTAQAIAARTTSTPRGVMPQGVRLVTVGIDLGKWMCHWAALAWGPHATPHVVDYGTLNVPSRDMAIEEALLAALREFRDTALVLGWKTDGDCVAPACVMVDAGYFPNSAFEFCQESGETYLPTKGIGATQALHRGDKRQTGSRVIGVGDHYSAIEEPGRAIHEIEVQADHWKAWVHARWATPVGKPGAMTIYAGRDHLGFAKQQVAEKQTQEFVAGKGLVTRFEQIHPQNHWLDSTALACVAGHLAGARLFEDERAAPRTTHPAEDYVDPAQSVNHWKEKW